MTDNTQPTIEELQAELEQTKHQRDELAAMLSEAVGAENVAAFLEHWQTLKNKD
tara:strand:+ start:195 stop:356 length:162 start_codon:yes stop_codon:yes gene_type:complete